MTTAAARPLRDARASATSRSLLPLRIPARLTKPQGVRAATAQLYAGHLTTTTSRTGDRYGPRTIEGYLETLQLFDAYLVRTGYAGDHADLTHVEVNGFLSDYRASHTQGGTWTKRLRLRPFFNWLEATFETPNPYAAGKVDRYAPSEPPPSALADGVIEAMLATCAGKDFEAVRDRAILEVFATGVRRVELAGLHVEDLDLVERVVNVQAVKDARNRAAVLRVVDGQEQRVGRTVPLSQTAAVALHQYLRMRGRHKLVRHADSGPLWYATRGRAMLTGNGIYQMVKRRARAAGFDPKTVSPHAFRHTRTHQLLAGGLADGDVMALQGWRDRAMLDRYARNLASTRAIAAARNAGLA